MLHVPLPLPRSTHVIVVFGKYEPPQAILLGEAVDETHAMFLRPLGEVVGYAEVQRVVRSVGMIYTHPGIPRVLPSAVLIRGWPARGRS